MRIARPELRGDRVRLVGMSFPMPHGNRRVLTMLLAGTLLSACAPSGTSDTKPVVGGGGQASIFHAPDVTISPSDKTQGVVPDTVVTVASSGGNIRVVSVLENGSTTPLPGVLSATQRKWTAKNYLAPESSYTIRVNAIGPEGIATDAISTFTTAGGARLTTDALPGDGATVGVGMPIKLRFNTPIPAELQMTLVNHVQVKSVPQVQGDWHWFSPYEVHWRPADFWPAGTHVTVTANLQGVDAGNGVFGYANWSSSFVVGPKHVSIIDHNTEMMQVFTNDQLVNTIPVSLGKPGFPTISGTLVVWYTAQKVMMDSCASGIECRTWAPDYYKEYVYWDTAISTNGFFIHSAPWDIFAQGHYDYSHGCVNVSPDNAIFFYNYSQIGDVVIIKNTDRVADAGDGEGDWQIPFDQFANSGGAATPTPRPSTSGGI